MEVVPSPNVHLMESVLCNGVLKFVNAIVNGLEVDDCQLKLTTRLHGGGMVIILQISLTHGADPVLFFCILKQTV